MAGPTYGASGSYLESDTAAPSFGAPSSVVADSVVVIAAYVDGTADPAIVMASGWAHAPGSPVYEDDDPLDGSSQNHRLVIAWHRASGSESGPYAPWTTTGSRFTSGQAHRFEGCKTSGDPFDTANDVAGKTLSVTDSPSVSITTSGDNELVLHAATNWAGGPWTPNTGYTERQDGGSFHHCFLGEKAQAAAGSTGSVVATATGNNKSQAWLGALQPPAAGSVSGTISASLGALTASVTGTRTTPGTVSCSLGALTAHVTGTRTTPGSVAASLGALTAHVTGIRSTSGTVSCSLGALTATARQQGAVSGTISASLGALTVRVVQLVETVVAGDSSGWWKLAALYRQKAPPAPELACPRCGWPLQEARGVRYCPHGDYRSRS